MVEKYKGTQKPKGPEHVHFSRSSLAHGNFWIPSAISFCLTPSWYCQSGVSPSSLFLLPHVLWVRIKASFSVFL